MANPFEFLNTINETKVDMMVDDIAEKSYNAFLTNRGLSYFVDTILIANEMNLHHHLPNRLQYSFLLLAISKKKRRSKWLKPETSDDIELLKAHYGYSETKARSALSLLTPEQLQIIRAANFRGGTSK